MPRLRIAPLVLSLAVTGGAVLLPVVMLALFTRSTVESDISARLREERVSTAQLASALVRQRAETAVTDLAQVASRVEFEQAAAARDRQRLESFLFPSEQEFGAIGVVDASGAVLGQVGIARDTLMNPSLASDVASAARTVAPSGVSSIYVVSGVSYLLGPGTWSLIGNDGRSPMAFGSAGMLVIPFAVGGDRFAIYASLRVVYFQDALDLVTLPSARAIVVFDEYGRILLRTGEGAELLGPALGAVPEGLPPIPTQVQSYAPWLPSPVAVPDLKDALSTDVAGEDMSIAGHEQIATHVPVLPGHWALYVLDRPGTAVGEQLTRAVTLAAGVAVAAALGLALLLAVLIERLRRQRTELAEASRQIALASKNKSEFLASMSHELRTPLNSINGFSDVLLTGIGGPLTEKQREYLADIRGSGDHLLALVNDVLDLSKVEAGKMELQPTEFDLRETVEGVQRVVAPLAQQKGQRLTLEVGEVGTVRLDQGRLRQVLLNVLSNAVKYTPDGGSVTTSVLRRDGTVWIAVRDSGIGVAPEDQARVFDDFARLDTDYARTQQGTGLGLALARRLVRLMGGDITLVSAQGQGSTFTITVPAAVAR